MNRTNYFNFISEKINAFARLIESQGSLNLLDHHIHAEIFFRDFLNLLFGWNLKKTEHNNESGIDLIDENNRIVVSVSSTATKQKIESSLENVDLRFSNYAFKFMSIAKEASKLKTKTYSNPHQLIFNPSGDIYDVKTLLDFISRMEINQLFDVYKFIKKELHHHETSAENINPIDRFKDYLADIENWKEIETEEAVPEEIAYYYEPYPEFRVIENKEFHEKYEEPWCSQFPDPNSHRYEYLAKYHDTILSKVYVVVCDGNRFFTAEPSIWLGESITDWFYSYYLIEDSIEYLVGKLIQEKGGAVNLRNPLVYEDIKIFDSEELAKESIDYDFSNNWYEYIYYSFDKKTQVYSRIVEGEKVELPLSWLKWRGNLEQLRWKPNLR
ncbi:MAG: SMEK domain-containing protein [Methylovulum sp.]|uniref:SMEK domain-containing protein n=1 Tax=Methylovulum sp. TaxID=1916980 RepID=UPI002606DEF2|nr:SMEK domain-containing protein [Methylovulum sp.]MDD2724341.1 SMEK domain-containing protein [Methylovulum sp.]MDD5124937.1 SMEK domain-containing protein [Methylovulum sp.]